MKYIKKISIVTAFVFLFHTAAFAADVKLVSEQEKKPKFSIFSLFKKKTSEQRAIETTVTQNAESFTASNGVLSVTKNTPANGSLNSTVPGEGVVVFAIETPPQKGTVDITDTMTGDFVYTPNQDETGDDSFVFSATNETYGKQTATISVTIAEATEESPSPSPTDTATPTETPTPTPTSTVYTFRYEDMIGHWGETSAVKLAEDNILRGFKIGNKNFFYPEVELTRGDFILYLVSAMGLDVSEYSEITSPFADAEETPAWMNLQAKAAYDAGIIKGSQEGDKIYLYPTEKLTRLEAVAMLNNTIKPDVVSVGAPDYTDMYLVPEWGVIFIQNMTGYGLLKGFDDGTVRPYAKITRAMAAEMINQTLMYKAEHPEVVNNLKQEMDQSMSY